MLTALLVTGCADPTESEAGPDVNSATTAARPSVAVSVQPAPEQRNQTDRPAVTFDPCYDVGDSTIHATGFDPKTRERGDSNLAADTYTFLGCEFEQKGSDGLTTWSMSLMATNITMPEIRKRYADTIIKEYKIENRDAVTYRLPGDSYISNCFLAMDSPAGVINMHLDIYAGRASGDACERTRSVAEIIQKDLPRS